MITDKLTTFANGEALNTGAAGTYLVGDVVDLEVARDIGNAVPMYLVVTIPVTATSGGSATLQIQLVSDAQAAIATDGSATIHLASDVFTVAALSAGTNVMRAVLPLEGASYERYLGILQITGTAAFTAGTVSAMITPTPSAWKAYADNNK